MKTRLILLGIALTAILSACADRDETINETNISPQKKVFIPKKEIRKQESNGKKSDTIKTSSAVQVVNPGDIVVPPH
ncbi:hypothetical protein [Chryseobacterium sp. CT-SW4]|jgi:hypothetical protein|uniref:hypothetical protein n=1 Tax=Chryseobacterium sp. SW-1 TaxID=3157343 RepID=UPI003B015DB9